MILLSVTGLFRMMIDLLVIYLVVRFFTRLLLPVVMEDYVKTAKRKAEKERQEIYRAEKKREGKISIDTGSYKGRKYKNDDADYIDYEEVK